MSETPERPSQVSFALFMTMGAALLLVLSGFESLNSLASIERMEALEDAIASFEDRGFSVDLNDVLLVQRVAWNLMVACAVAAFGCAAFSLRGDRRARIALAVLSVAIATLVLPTAGLVGIAIIVGSGMLWTKSAQAWFNAMPQRAGTSSGGTSSGGEGR